MAAALLVAGAVGFGLLAAGYEHDPLASLDHDVSEWVSSGLPTWVEWLARPFSWIGGWIGLTALGVAAVVLLARERSWLDLAFFLTAFLGCQLAVVLVKQGFDRARPDAGSPIPLPESASFPSGHAASGAASVGAVTILLAERLASRRARAWVWTVAVVLGVAIGLSRIALDVHYVTDVLAGWCFGLAWLAACLLAREAIRARRPSPA